ncbi:hypothetical protein HN873_022551 [Arachis hypogaea]
MCRLERRCSFHGCAAPVFPTPRCGIPALPQPFLSAVPSWDCRGSSKTRPWSYPSRRSCEATVACVRVLFSRVRCTRSGWGLRSPSVPQMIGFLGKMPAAVSVQSFPSRGRRQRGAQVIVCLMVPTTRITVVILELIRATNPDFWKGCIY